MYAAQGGGGGGATKMYYIPILRGTIVPSIHNGFSRPSGKRLQLYSWDMDGKYIGL